MKNWADHCSSDEEDFVEGHDDVSTVAEDEAPEQLDADLVQYDKQAEETAPAPPKTFDWPEAAPFTAYVGNLAYSIDEAGKLAEEVTKLAQEMLNMEVKVVNSRLARVNNNRNHHNRGNEADKQKPHRGYGYVEFETLEQLKAVVEGLGGGKIAGRAILLDTANFPSGRQNRSEGSQIDGIRFRGGKHTNNNKGRRQQQEEGPPPQRSSLKLQPRTKPIEETSVPAGGNIFGGGRAREEGTWQSRRDAEKKSNNNGVRGGKPNTRHGGRGEGAGRGRRDAVQAVGDKKVKDDKKATGPAVAIQRPEKVEKPQKPAAVVNRFAALGFDSDSD